ncbi:MAG: transglutaminase-like domain-containing protein [candidate division WOR-3 bacterium]
MARRRLILITVLGIIFLILLFYYIKPGTAPHIIKEEEIEKIPTEEVLFGEKIEELWMGVYVGDKKVGYAYTKLNRKDKRREIYQKMYLKVIQLGQVQELFATTIVNADSNYVPKDFDFILESMQQKMKVKGVFKGDKLFLKVETPEFKRDLSLEIQGLSQLPLTLEKIIEENKVEKKMEFSYFDPTTFKMEKGYVENLGEVQVDYKGKKVKAKQYRIVAGGLNTFVWVDDKGILKEETQPEMVFLRETPEEAMKIEGKPLNILLKFAVKPEGKKIDELNRENYKRIVYRLSNIDLSLLDLEFGTQKILEKGENYAVIEVLKSSVNEVKKIDTTNLSRYLKPSAFIQSDDPLIIDFAKKGAGNFDDFSKIAKSLTLYVYNYLEKSAVVSFPSALDVLKMKKGDCNEHSVLFAAAARALKIPSEIAVGLVFTDGYFYYHAWNVIYLNKWVFVDPTFGQFPADPLHIMLKLGGVEKQADVMAVVGKIKIEILDIE